MSVGTHKQDLAKKKIDRLTSELKTAKLDLKAATATVKNEKAASKAKKSLKK